MVTGQRAFPGVLADVLVAKQDVERLGVPAGAAPRELAQVIGRATARDLADRIATAAELRHLIAPWTGAAAPTSAAPRRLAEIDDLRTVVVVPPAGDDERLHLAEGVHEELLRRLVRRSRVRVLPRADGTRVPGATIVELYASELLSATIRSGRAQTTLHLPLDIASVGPAADAIASAVVETVGRRGPAAADPAARALEMLLRARMLAQRSFSSVQRAVELLEQAHSLCPEDPRIAATLAMLCVRFVVVGDGEDNFQRARSLVHAALAAAPKLAESHVAAGHLELHTGNPVVAAAHFRTAIACSPYVAEAHEALGRMLLEAGFLDVGMARLDDALAISPKLTAARWDIARAYALEEAWPAYDKLEAELEPHRDRAMTRLRIAWWRGDLAKMTSLYDQIDEARVIGLPAIAGLRAIVFEGAWREHRDALVEHALRARSPSLRRRAFVAQIAAEAAGHAGDARVCNAMIDHAVACGLYDLHWFDRCPLIEPGRRTREGAAARVQIKQRAEAILDALYGDNEMLSDTIVG
jgi:tetratricopeptide (TPR) repeat protein